jgi:lipopolysaccharide/colanic/teichoic acid biosynthesis glycosyltransferase
MRRADRSGTLLSLVIYRLAQTCTASDEASLRNVLLNNKRETDIVGQLDEGVLAVICPDTGDDGIHQFIEKMDARSGELPYSVESATYPDHLFDGLDASPDAIHGPSPLLLAGTRPRSGDGYFLKRPLDIIGALLALVLFSPLMLITALAVRFSSPGPVVFRQTRLGQGGVPFTFYKFRSMVANGDDRIHREYVANLIKGEHDKVNQQDAANPRYKLKADPRVTWVGRIIRKTSIDELPQLFNVLKGDMSLVGPRPPLPYEAQNYKSWHLRRVLDIKPGITGAWQVEGRSKVSFDDMVRMDLRYVRGCSLEVDLGILAKTVLVVLNCDGAG